MSYLQADVSHEDVLELRPRNCPLCVPKHTSGSNVWIATTATSRHGVMVQPGTAHVRRGRQGDQRRMRSRTRRRTSRMTRRRTSRSRTEEQGQG